jgi:putative transposase
MIRLQSNPYEYRRNLPHYQKFDRPLFVTFRKRTPEPLLPAARSLVFHHCLEGNSRTMHLHAVVIMPEHVHLLLTPLRNAEGTPFPLKDILKLVKGPSARSINRTAGTHGALWQD